MRERVEGLILIIILSIVVMIGVALYVDRIEKINSGEMTQISERYMK